MNQNQQLQQAMKDCQNAMSQLHSLAEKTSDTRMKSTLNESAHHLHMCIHEIEFASKQAP